MHNNFGFISENTRILEKQITLHFKKSTGDWAIDTKYLNLYFLIDNYTFLKQIDAKPQFIDDDTCLAGITFFDSNFREEDYELIDRQNPNEDDDVIFSFESDRVIRVNCDTITLTAE